MSSASNVAVVVVAVGLWGIAVFAMYRGWKNRGVRQTAWVGDLPVVPDKTGPVRLETTSGLYIGSSFAENWQARVAAHGLGARAVASMTGFPNGIVLERAGSEPLWIPRTSIIEVRTDKRLAGKAMTEDGLLVIRWHPPGASDGNIQIDSGFRGDDKAVYPLWITEFDSAPGGDTKGNSGQGRKASE